LWREEPRRSKKQKQKKKARSEGGEEDVKLVK